MPPEAAGILVSVSLALVAALVLLARASWRLRGQRLAGRAWEQALDASEDAFYLIDLQDRLVRANRTFYDWIGKDASELVGETIPGMLHRERDARSCEVCRARRERRDGRFVREADDPHNPFGHPIEIRVSIIRDESGAPTGVLQVLRDLRRERASQEALRESEERFRYLSDAAFEGVAIHDNGVIVAVNQALPRMMACKAEDLIGMPATGFVDEGSRRRMLERIHHHSDEPLEIAGRRLDGTPFRAELRARDLPIQGRQLRVVAVRDITDLAQANDELTAQTERLSVTLEAIGEGVIATDRDSRVQFINPVACRLTGWPLDDAVGAPLAEVVQILDDRGQPIADPVRACLAADAVLGDAGDHTLRRRDGNEFAVEHTAAPVHDAAGRQVGAVLALRDVSAVRGMARQLLYQASHDSLTGLINRGEFECRLQESLERVRKQPGHQDALCYLDLDQFKVVNDTCGHIAGDAMLKQLASLLHASLREHDVLARLGGDEFGVLLHDCPPDAAGDVADSLRRTVREFRFVWQDRTFDVGVSIGLVAIGADCGSVTELLSAADSACYVAKDQGRNRIQVYHPDDHVLVRHQGEMQWVQRISRAVERDRLVLYAQPVVPLQDTGRDRRSHFEILVRMLDEEGQLVPPMAFIPAAERFNVMSSVDRWVVRETLAIMADQHQGRGIGQLACAINLSGQSLCDPSFLHYVLEQIRYHGIPAQNVCFEITETAAIANFTQAQRFLAEIRELGSCFALDDFGSGLSSFAYLKNLPVDYLKIDGSFVRDMVDDPIDFAMVESINQLGHVMGIRTIAEYVENESIRASLQQLGVDFAQGYAVGGVSPFDELLGSLRAANP